MASLMNEPPEYPMAKKYLTNVNLAKLFEDPEHPIRIQRIMADGSPVLVKADIPEPIQYIY